MTPRKRKSKEAKDDDTRERKKKKNGPWRAEVWQSPFVLVAEADELAGKRAHSQRRFNLAVQLHCNTRQKQSRCFQTRQVFCLHRRTYCDAATDSIVRRAGALHLLEALFSTRN